MLTDLASTCFHYLVPDQERVPNALTSDLSDAVQTCRYVQHAVCTQQPQLSLLLSEFLKSHTSPYTALTLMSFGFLMMFLSGDSSL